MSDYRALRYLAKGSLEALFVFVVAERASGLDEALVLVF